MIFMGKTPKAQTPAAVLTGAVIKIGSVAIACMGIIQFYEWAHAKALEGVRSEIATVEAASKARDDSVVMKIDELRNEVRTLVELYGGRTARLTPPDIGPPNKSN